MSKTQDELLEYLDDFETLKRAAEGSMEKRNNLMNPNPQPVDEGKKPTDLRDVVKGTPDGDEAVRRALEASAKDQREMSERAKQTDTPDPLTDMFEDIGIKVVDCTPKVKPNESVTFRNEQTDTEELRELLWYELGDGLNATDVNEAVVAILSLKQQWQLEARIEECEQLMALKWSVDERIAELEAQLTQSGKET